MQYLIKDEMKIFLTFRKIIMYEYKIIVNGKKKHMTKIVML